jgi:chromosomal replication initiator protein
MIVTNKEITRAKQIQTIVSNETGIKISDICSKSRKANLVQARHLSMHFTRWYCRLPLKEIAKLHSQNNHATVIHADSCITYDIRKNSKLNDLYEIIRSQVKAL